jgi:hypothetical protein
MTDPFKYFLAADDPPIKRSHKIWGDPIPVSRNQQQKAAVEAVCYGDYFQAVRRFLEENRFEILSKAASSHLNTRVDPGNIADIHVILEKHGEFYHPSRIKTVIGDHTLQFVVNAAVSDPGRETLEREYGLLQHLNKKRPSSFIPRVYAKAAVQVDSGAEIKMFIGEWFEGYSEFHYTHSPDGGKTIVVWDTEKSGYCLSEDQTRELYQEAARILTFYYDPATFEQVYPWHHAAGDFVILLQDGKVDVKLVTVRGLQSPLDPAEMEKRNQDLQSMLEAMLVFFLNLSIRMRLDRIDGVGEVVWSHDAAVQGTVDGFFSSLASKPQIRLTPVPLSDSFQYYLSTYNEHDLYDLAEDIVNAYHPLAPEVPVIKKNLEHHIRDLILVVNNR